MNTSSIGFPPGVYTVKASLAGFETALSSSVRVEVNKTRAARYFGSGAFTPPASHNVFGTLRRNALNGPSTWGANLALLKRVKLTERLNLQLRGEAFNLNHNNLNNPNTTISSSDYGRILTRSGNRVIQLGARFTF